MKYLSLPLVLLLIFTNSYSQSQGPNDPSSGVNAYNGCLGCPGGEWSNPSAVNTADGNCTEAGLAYYPYCFQTACHYSRYLLVTDFGFNIPTSAIVTGLKAEILRKSNMPSLVRDTIISLFTTGAAPSGDNKAAPIDWS